MTHPKVFTTNYFNTFIEVAEDAHRTAGTMPEPGKKGKTIAAMQFEMVARHPYGYTSDEVLFQVFADRNDLTEPEYEHAKAAFFSKGQPCFRASPLPKSYGFGVHFNEAGKMAIYGVESEKYRSLVADPTVTKLKAMRSSRA